MISFLPPPSTFPNLACLIQQTEQDDALYNTGGRWDFGTACLLDAREIQHTFTLKNQTSRPITLTQIKVGCPCLVATGKTKLPVTIPPKGTYEVTVRVLLYTMPAVGVEKNILLYAGEKIVGRLPVSGSLVPLVTFSPSPLSLGDIAIGQNSTSEIRLTLNPRLSKITLPPLISSSPAIRITPQEDLPTYKITLSPGTMLGPLSGIIGFDISPTDKSVLADVWRGASMTFYGTITGDISATPTSVHFGLIPAFSTNNTSTEIVREVTITENVPGALNGVKIISESPHVKTKWENATKQLRLTLTPPHTKGSFQTRVILETKSGQKLPIVIVTYIS